MRAAYRAESALAAEAQLEALAKELDRTHARRGRQPTRGPGRDADRAAPERSAHPRAHAALDQLHRVDDLDRAQPLHEREDWQNGTMALRWCAAGMIEARGQFRRVNGHLHLAALRLAINVHVDTQTVGACVMMNP